ASLPVYPPNPCRIPASVFDGAPEIKGKIKNKIKGKIKSQIKSGSLRIVVGGARYLSWICPAFRSMYGIACAGLPALRPVHGL
ncbi:hypothetical protein, partial [Pseudomonas lurida]|uniref:hypothetical protein n=1 Tax=Pseudomonas lurida TaxID=244566 RepID=UPI0034D97F2B